MKLTVILAILVTMGYSVARASEVDQLIGDTKEVIGKHYEGAYQFDFNGETKKELLSVGSQVVAWRFLAIQPTLSYAPNASNSVVDVELMFPLRLNKVPVALDKTLSDLFPKGKIGGWVDRLTGGFYTKVNLTQGGWRFGWRLAFGGTTGD